MKVHALEVNNINKLRYRTLVRSCYDRSFPYQKSCNNYDIVLWANLLFREDNR